MGALCRQKRFESNQALSLSDYTKRKKVNWNVNFLLASGDLEAQKNPKRINLTFSIRLMLRLKCLFTSLARAALTLLEDFLSSEITKKSSIGIAFNQWRVCKLLKDESKAKSFQKTETEAKKSFSIIKRILFRLKLQTLIAYTTITFLQRSRKFAFR